MSHICSYMNSRFRINANMLNSETVTVTGGKQKFETKNGEACCF